MDNPLERTAFDLGWLVGIIDGEGSFTLNTRKTQNRAYFPTLQITNTNIRIIKRAQQILADHGLTCYFYARMPKTGKTWYRLEIAGIKRVKRLMDLLGKYFECRREQADCLMRYVNLRLSKQSHSLITEDEHRIVRELRLANE